MADNQPATKEDIADLRHEVTQNITDLRREFKQDLAVALQAQEDRLVERMRDMQTEILRAFHGWAQSMETRT